MKAPLELKIVAFQRPALAVLGKEKVVEFVLTELKVTFAEKTIVVLLGSYKLKFTRSTALPPFSLVTLKKTVSPGLKLDWFVVTLAENARGTSNAVIAAAIKNRQESLAMNEKKHYRVFIKLARKTSQTLS